MTLCSRLVLNLYEAGTPGTTTSNSAEPMTTCVLTTRVELDTSTDDRSYEGLSGISLLTGGSDNTMVVEHTGCVS